MLQMGGSIRGFGLVCQGQTWHSVVRAGGFLSTGAFRVGAVRWERKWEQSRDLLRGGVLKGKGAKTSLQATYRFPGLWQKVRRVYGVAQERAITDQVRSGSERSSTNDCQMWPVARTEIGPVTISKLTRRLGMISKSSIGSSSGPGSNPYRK